MSYPAGLDCVWLATDSLSFPAVFITAGVAPIPSAILESNVSFQEVEEQLWKLPEIANPRLLVKVKRPDDYLAFAKRGLFVYDWTDIHRPQSAYVSMYEMVAQPTQACILRDIPSELLRNVVSITTQNFTFSENSTIDICTYIQCTRP